MMLTMATTAVASILLAVGGYLLGARRGLRGRDELRAAWTAEQARCAQLVALLGAATGGDELDHQLLGQMVRDAVAPLTDMAPLNLAVLEGAFHRRSDLPALLEGVADQANLTHVVLSDEMGLPLATAGDPQRAETLAATSSLLLKLIDRLAASGLPSPLGAVIHDTSHQKVLYRVFDVCHERFVFTAVTKGRGLAPDSLDAAVARVETLLMRSHAD